MKKDDRIPRPKSISEARRIIAETFAAQGKSGWNEEEQSRYFAMINVDGMEAADDVRKIIADLGKSRQILFED